jgi:Uma2 family endonuclease
MTAASVPISQPPELLSPIMTGVSWETYERLRRELDEAGSNIRITYDRGRMVLMSPLPLHGKWTKLMGLLIEALAAERGILVSGFGNTTWKREDLRRGLEGDESYYVQHAEAMRGKADIDLLEDPPPDLAVEVELTHHPVDKLSIYADLRVPEVWRYDGRRVEALILQQTGSYAASATSAAFPGFSPPELHRFLSMFPSLLDAEIVAEFRKWVREAHR